MMGHEKHCNCLMCKMGKAMCMSPTCNDQHCADPIHTKEKEEEKGLKDQEHNRSCDCC